MSSIWFSRSQTILPALAYVLFAAAAQAAPLTITASGTIVDLDIDGAHPAAAGPFSHGAPFEFVLSFDTSAPESTSTVGNPTTSTFMLAGQPSFSFALTVGGATFTAPAQPRIVLVDSLAGDAFRFFSGFIDLPPTWTAITGVEPDFFFELSDASGNMLSSAQLTDLAPFSLDDIDSVPANGHPLLRFDPTGRAANVNIQTPEGTLLANNMARIWLRTESLSFSPVPEPAACVLALLGAGGLLLARRRACRK